MAASKIKWHKKWHVRLGILAAVLGGLELSLSLWQGVVPSYVFAGMSTITVVAATAARFLKKEVTGSDV